MVDIVTPKKRLFIMRDRTYWPGGRSFLSDPLTLEQVNKKLTGMVDLGAKVNWDEVKVAELKLIPIEEISEVKTVVTKKVV